MKTILVALALAASPAMAGEPLLSGGELGELRYACTGEDAIDLYGTEEAVKAACDKWKEMEAKARADGMCPTDDNEWQPCA